MLAGDALAIEMRETPRDAGDLVGLVGFGNLEPLLAGHDQPY